MSPDIIDENGEPVRVADIRPRSQHNGPIFKKGAESKRGA
jgi:hypothetical protein